MIGKPGAAKIVEIFLRSLFGLSLCLSLAIVKLGTGSSAIRFQISLQVLGEEGGTSMSSLAHRVLCGRFDAPRDHGKLLPVI